MKEYKVRILDTVFADIGDIADYIVSVSNGEHAIEYTRQLGAEIMSLRYLADVIPVSGGMQFYATTLRHAKCELTIND